MVNNMKRNYKIDLLRIILIVLVIIVHISNLYLVRFTKISLSKYTISLFFNSFSRICVPLFFMISGALLINEKYDKKKYFTRIIKFIIILIIWSIIYSILNETVELKTFFLSLFNARSTQRHLWFMYVIIGLYIALPFIQNMCKNMTKELENLFIILWSIFSGLAVIYEPLINHIANIEVNVEYPIPIIQATYYLGYFILGHILYKRIENNEINIKNRSLILIYILSSLITFSFTLYSSIKLNYHYESMLWYKSIFTIIASTSIFLLVLNKNYNIKNEKIIKYFSSLTFGIYLIHMIFLNKITEHYLIINYSPILTIPILSLIILFLSIICISILKKIPYINKIIC